MRPFSIEYVNQYKSTQIVYMFVYLIMVLMNIYAIDIAIMKRARLQFGYQPFAQEINFYRFV